MIKFYKKSDNLFILGNVVIPSLLYFCNIDENAGTVSFIPVNDNDKLPEYFSLPISNFCDEVGDAYSSIDDIYNILTDFFVNASLLNGGTIDGYIKLGSDAPAIKMKYLTGTLATVGNNATISTGIDASKVVGVSILVPNSGGLTYVPPSYSGSGAVTDSYYTYLIEGTDCIIITGSSATAVAGQTAQILITYKE